MPELAVTPAPLNLSPPVRFEDRDHLVDLLCHALWSVRARPSGTGRAGIDLTTAYRASVPDAWVYMLHCRDGSLYTGWCVDVARRLREHRAGRASKYTASRLPVELVFAAAQSDRAAARREEARIKALDRRGKLALIAAAGAHGGSVEMAGA
jgi:putative endonuclease